MLKFDKALFVYNSHAGDEDTEKKLAQTVPILHRAVKELILLHTETEQELQQACAKYSSQVDLLIILGGDGTVHSCINSIAPLQKRPVIGILPGGTSNDFSRTLGIPQSLPEAAESLITGSIIDADVGKTDGKYFMNFWGIGLVTETSQNVNSGQKKYLGAVSYFLSTLRTLGQTEPFMYKLKVGKELIEGEAVLLLVLNGRFIGTVELPISDTSPFDGQLDVLIINNTNLATFRELLSLQKPEIDSVDLQDVEHFRTDELEILQPVRKAIDMDGEIATDRISKITVLPSHLSMIRANEKRVLQN